MKYATRIVFFVSKISGICAADDAIYKKRIHEQSTAAAQQQQKEQAAAACQFLHSTKIVILILMCTPLLPQQRVAILYEA